MTNASSILITGASSGIGATYADRFAQRGHNLILVARDKARLEALAARLRQEHGVDVDVLQADLTQEADLAVVEARLRDDTRIGVLINNAGAAQTGDFLAQTGESIEQLIALNWPPSRASRSLLRWTSTPSSLMLTPNRFNTGKAPAPAITERLLSNRRLSSQPLEITSACEKNVPQLSVTVCCQSN